MLRLLKRKCEFACRAQPSSHEGWRLSCCCFSLAPGPSVLHSFPASLTLFRVFLSFGREVFRCRANNAAIICLFLSFSFSPGRAAFLSVLTASLRTSSPLHHQRNVQANNPSAARRKPPPFAVRVNTLSPALLLSGQKPKQEQKAWMKAAIRSDQISQTQQQLSNLFLLPRLFVLDRKFTEDCLLSAETNGPINCSRR